MEESLESGEVVEIAVMVQTRQAFTLKASSDGVAERFVKAHFDASSYVPFIEATMGPAVSTIPCRAYTLDQTSMETLLNNGPSVEEELAALGMKADSLYTEDLDLVYKHWPYNRGDDLYVHTRVCDAPSVALRDASGALAAFCFSSPYGTINGLHVMEEHRRKGLATQVVRLMARVALARPNKTCWLHTVMANTSGLALFASLGFVDQGLDTWAFWCDYHITKPVA